LVASVLDSRSLMFAMPKHKRYGYLEILDVSSLILTEGSAAWSEREWRKKLKELTGTRMNTTDESESGTTSRANSRTKRLSFGHAAGGKPRVGFADDAPPPTVRTSRSMSLNSGPGGGNGSAPMDQDRVPPVTNGTKVGHVRNTSDSHLAGSFPHQVTRQNEDPYSVSSSPGRGPNLARTFVNDLAATPERVSSDEETPVTPVRDFDGIRRMQTPEPVSQPPTFSHAPGDKPNNRPYHSPEMRRANSRLSINTLKQLAKAGNVPVGQDVWSPDSERSSEEQKAIFPQSPDRHGPHPVHSHANNMGMPANMGSGEAAMNNDPRSPGQPPFDVDSASQRSRSPFNQAMGAPPGSRGPTPNPRPKTPTSRPGTATGNRPPGPPPHGPPQGNHHPGYRPPPSGPLPGPPGRGRGRPPLNMPAPIRGHPNNGPPGMYQQGPPEPSGRGRPRSPPPNRGGPPTLNTSPPIHRKPLPARSDSLQQRPGRDNINPATESASSGSFTGNRIDAEGFGQVRAHNASSPTPQPGIRRHDTMVSQDSSRYDDGASTTSPDYASSRPSTETASSVERPRAGVLRTVGAAEAPLPRAGELGFDIPGIDFGPTLNYAAAPRSMTSSAGITAQSSISPGTQSPATTLSQRPSKSEVSHAQKDSKENVRRSVVWQPGGAVAGSSGPTGPVLSAEEFVQHRAAAAATPLYAHQRHSSGITLSGYRAGTPTPPLSRGQDTDYLGTAHSRNNSQDLLQRPGSRGAGEVLQRPKSRELLQRPGSRGAGAVLGGQQAQGESHLSAREQEHVARVTGSPLINMAGNKSGTQAGGGLVGAIEAREREREHMKHGWTSQAAQSAIQRQQQQQAYQQYHQPMASPGLPPPAGMYSNMGGRGMVPQSPRQQGFGMQTRYGSPSPGTDQGYWAPGSGGYRSPPPGNMDPRFMASQAQFSPSPPFSPGPQGASGAGRGQSPNAYHGQAF
jgi:CCR4-NOT transcriptional complex subunit CAF120